MMILKKKRMKSDIKEQKDAYIIDAELPGFDKEDIKVYVQDGYLIISASQNKEFKKEHGKYLREERYSGSYERNFFIGDDMNVNDIKASYKHGVLRLILPKPQNVYRKGHIKIA